MLFAIIHEASGAIEEYREADDAEAALAGFLEVLSYIPMDYEAHDATGVDRLVRQRWDGSSFAPDLPTDDELKDEEMDNAGPVVTAVIEEVAIIKGIPVNAFRGMLKARMK